MDRELHARIGVLDAERRAVGADLAQGRDVVPIPGTTKTARLDENLGAVDVALSARDCACIEALRLHESVAGSRYADMAWVMRESP